MKSTFDLDGVHAFEVGHDLYPKMAGGEPLVDLGVTETPIGWKMGQSDPYERIPEPMSSDDAVDPNLTFYGPTPCPRCGCMVVQLSHVDSAKVATRAIAEAVAFDVPDGPIYPNTRWVPHQHRPAPTPRTRQVIARSVKPSQARAIASAILSAATEARR